VEEIIDYVRLAAERVVTDATWDKFIRDALVDRWVASYEAISGWQTEILEISQGELTFLFDAGPTLIEARHGAETIASSRSGDARHCRIADAIEHGWQGSCRTRCSGQPGTMTEGISWHTQLVEDWISICFRRTPV
jgi:hypothetical protein